MEEIKECLEQTRQIWKEVNYANAYALYKILLEEDLTIHFYMEFFLGKNFQKAGEELKIVESLSRDKHAERSYSERS